MPVCPNCGEIVMNGDPIVPIANLSLKGKLTIKIALTNLKISISMHMTVISEESIFFPFRHLVLSLEPIST